MEKATRPEDLSMAICAGCLGDDGERCEDCRHVLTCRYAHGSPFSPCHDRRKELQP